MFKPQYSLETLKTFNKKTIADVIGIEYLEVGKDYIIARMPVDERTHQPFGLLHGGASVVLAETLGSVASTFCIDDLTKQTAVGVEINANHIRGVKEGWVYGKVTPLHVGRTTHVWDIKITNEAGKLVCVSRITIAVIDIKKQ